MGEDALSRSLASNTPQYRQSPTGESHALCCTLVPLPPLDKKVRAPISEAKKRYDGFPANPIVPASLLRG